MIGLVCVIHEREREKIVEGGEERQERRVNEQSKIQVLSCLTFVGRKQDSQAPDGEMELVRSIWGKRRRV